MKTFTLPYFAALNTFTPSSFPPIFISYSAGYEHRGALRGTPGSGEHGPRFLTGGPGAAPGGVASKNGWVYMRVQGGFNFLYQFCVSAVCVLC